MPRFRVTIQELADYTIEVDAASENEACTTAERRFLDQDIDSWPCEVHEREIASVELMGSN